MGYDFLFTVDYEYDSKLSQTVATQRIRDIRDQIMSKLMADSPFNVRVTLHCPFLNTYASIYKFLVKVDPFLQVPRDQRTRYSVSGVYMQMDVDFDDYSKTNMTFEFQIDSINSSFNHLKQNFEVFYTLKLYFYAFEIQKHCINSLLEYNRRLYHIRQQLCELFRFIWNNSVVEQKYRKSYPGEVLFETPDFFP